MPYILIQVTDEGVTKGQKEAMIAGATELMVNVLNKDPEAIFRKRRRHHRRLASLRTSR